MEVKPSGTGLFASQQGHSAAERASPRLLMVRKVNIRRVTFIILSFPENISIPLKFPPDSLLVEPYLPTFLISAFHGHFKRTVKNEKIQNHFTSKATLLSMAGKKYFFFEKFLEKTSTFPKKRDILKVKEAFEGEKSS